ncbi:helix-turn-helix transcriptional regulator [Sphingomonas sp. KC8]|uniref:helix-turn-helix transcriptional regulator n=1 Tax=Sphingomonas sp. KC8 TaxID=1030157 RepID=UPI0002489F9B|nr:hypothetical protein [Sphingomonas sp. KC8]ARS28029.1 hypothetical protein KC8_12125 [Sphingomonas sp. KC8]
MRDGEITDMGPVPQLGATAAAHPGERRQIARPMNGARGPLNNWQVRVDASPLSDAWKAAVDFSGGDSCIGVLAALGPQRRGTVLSSGCSQSDLTFIDIEGLRGWLEGLIAEKDHHDGNLVMVDPNEVADIAKLPWLKRLSRLAAGCIDVPNEGVFWMLIGWRNATEPASIDKRRLRLALRVLAQCAATHALNARRERRVRILEGMIDELAPAFILVNQTAQVFWTNYRAELLLAERDLLVRNGGNMLASSIPAQTAVLREAIGRVGRSLAPGADAEDEFLLLPRNGGGDLVVLRSVIGRHGLEGNRAVLVIVPQHDASEMASKLISAFGLIPSEARLVGALISGGSSAAAAARVGITEQSAKTYLKRIYAKLGISSQLELGILVASLTPPLRSGEPRAEPDRHQIMSF